MARQKEDNIVSAEEARVRNQKRVCPRNIPFPTAHICICLSLWLTHPPLNSSPSSVTSCVSSIAALSARTLFAIPIPQVLHFLSNFFSCVHCTSLGVVPRPPSSYYPHLCCCGIVAPPPQIPLHPHPVTRPDGTYQNGLPWLCCAPWCRGVNLQKSSMAICLFYGTASGGIG